MSLTKAVLRTETNKVIECLFNPAEITVAKSNSWQAGEAKGTNAPKLRFQGGQSATLTVTLMLDTTNKGTDVTEHTNKLLDLMKVDKALPGADAKRNSARPPWVEFHWGTLHSFKAVVERLTLRFTYFSNSGMPLRAKADLGLKQWDDEEIQAAAEPHLARLKPAQRAHRDHRRDAGPDRRPLLPRPDAVAADRRRQRHRRPAGPAVRPPDLHPRATGARPWLRTAWTPPSSPSMAARCRPSCTPALLQVRVEESVHLPDAFEIRFEDAYFKLFDEGSFTLGDRVQIAHAG